MPMRVLVSIVGFAVLVTAAARVSPSAVPPQQTQENTLPDDLAFPTWTAFQELEITVRLIIQTSPPEQREQMLRILNATAASPEVSDDIRAQAIAVRERLATLLEQP